MDEEYLKRLGLSIARGVPQMATGFVDLAALPFTMTGLLDEKDVVGGTAYLTEKGLLPPPQEGVIPETLELVSGAMSPGGAGKEISLGLLGMFAGRNAKTADLNALERFYDLEVDGVSPAKSYEKTGWMYGAEGAPKYEISDAAAKISPEFLAKPKNQPGLNLGKVLDHPELYAAYPELKDTNFLISDQTQLAGYAPKQNTILVNPKVMDEIVAENNPQRLASILLHELQHNVQKIEGFERGGSSSVVRNILAKQKEAEMGELMSRINKFDEDAKAAILDRNVFEGRLKNLTKQENKSQDTLNEISEIRNLLEKTEPIAKQYKQSVNKYRKLERLNDTELYERIAGEAEARLTQQRQSMPVYERKQQFPFRDLDVPYNELLFRSLLD